MQAVIDTIISNVGEIIGFTVLGVIAWMSRSFITNLEKRKLFQVNRAVNKNIQVFEKLVELRVSLDADRIKLFQFYNGDYYTTGEDALKFAMTYCIVKTGISYPAAFVNHTHGIPVSRIISVLQPFFKNKAHFQKISPMPECEWKNISLINGTQQVLFIRLGKAEAIQGFIAATWIEESEISGLEEALRLSEEIEAIMVKRI